MLAGEYGTGQAGGQDGRAKVRVVTGIEEQADDGRSF